MHVRKNRASLCVRAHNSGCYYVTPLIKGGGGPTALPPFPAFGQALGLTPTIRGYASDRNLQGHQGPKAPGLATYQGRTGLT